MTQPLFGWFLLRSHTTWLLDIMHGTPSQEM